VSDGLNCRVADMAVGKQGHVMHCNETNPPYELGPGPFGAFKRP
jgi:hypothetical protein